MTTSLVDLFNEICSDSKARDRIVLQDGSRQWTLHELDIQSKHLASIFIKDFGCRKNSCVAIYMNKCAEYVISYIAALRAGSAYLPLDISYPDNLLNSVIDEVQPSVICTTENYVKRLPESSARFLFHEGLTLHESVEVDLPSVGTDDVAYIVYSSGTTGKPKGIRCPHRGAVHSYKFRFHAYPYKSDDVVACNVFFVWELFRPILKGIKMIIVPDDVIYDSDQLCQFLKKHRVTRMLFTPSLLETILDTQKDELLDQAFKNFRVLHLCGEVVTSALLMRIMRHFSHIKIVNLYSISETHDVSTCDLNDFYKRKEERKFCPVGQLVEGVKVLIIDQSTGKRVPIGMSGEIYVAGPTLACGYINRPELNKNRFVDVPLEYQAEVGSNRMYRSGDWGYISNNRISLYMLPNSILEICGRCDTLVRIRGYSVELQAIESILLKMNHVRSAAVISIGEEGQDKQLAAYIVLRHQVTRKALRAELKRLLPFYMVPQFFVFMDKLPVLAASSKIDKKALPPVDYKRDVVEADALPSTPTERKLAEIWAEILQHSTLDIQESFFDLGGHSLMAARLLSKVNDEFDMRLTIRDLFAAPTVYEMAKILDGNERISLDQNVDLDSQIETHDIKDNVMDLHLRAFWRSTEWGNRFYRSNILLTGSTGFLGAFILHSLLLDSQANVFCLVRESLGHSVDARLKHALTKVGLWSDQIADFIRERVRIFSADIALFHFGLNEENYHFLSYEIDVVIHAGAYVNLVLPYLALHGGNVLGTRNVLDFCHFNKVKVLHYVSTDAVIPLGVKDVDENFDISSVKDKLNDGYGQSKYVAEQLVSRSQQRGLPSIIYRLGNQGAATKTAYWNDRDFTYLLLKAVIHLGKTPDIDWTVELTPVDFASKFITHLATRHFCSNAGKIFHLMNSQGPKWNELMNWLRSFGYELETIDADVWVETVENSIDPALQQIQRLVQVIIGDKAMLFTQNSYARTNTDKLLTELRWQYPSINESLIQSWLQLLVERHSIARPKPKKHATLTNKVCLVTGASEGIGEAIAKALAFEGAKVVLVARQKDKLDWIVENLKLAGVSPNNLLASRCDITQQDQVQKMVGACVEKFLKIDVLVNTAGVMYYCLAKNGYTDEWRRQIDVNCHGTTNVIGEVVPLMIKQNSGHILNITSDAGKRGFAGLAVYSGSKFFIEGFMQGLRQELIEYNIKITNIQPGDVRTKLAGRSTDKEASKKYDYSKAGHTILEVQDVANSVIYVVNQPAYVAINELLIEPQAAPI